MTITTTQKLIKIGTSRGVTLPAKELKIAGIKDGDEMRITIEPLETRAVSRVDAEYEKFKLQYGQTLKNLADR